MGKEGRAAKIAPVMVILAGICWGIVGIFTRELSQAGLSALQISFVRSCVTAVFLFLYLLIYDRKKLRIQLKDLWVFLLSGGVGTVFCNFCYLTTIQNASLSVAAIFLYTAPFMVVLFSRWVFREKITVRKGVALVVAFSGSALAVGVIGSARALGLTDLLIGLGAGMGYATYSILSRVALKKYDPFTVTAYTFLVATVVLLPFCGITDVVTKVAASGRVAANSALMGIVSTMLPCVSYTFALRHMETGKASILSFVEPLVATLAGVLVFHETLTLQNSVGMLMIFCAVVLLNAKLKRWGQSRLTTETKEMK